MNFVGMVGIGIKLDCVQVSEWSCCVQKGYWLSRLLEDCSLGLFRERRSQQSFGGRAPDDVYHLLLCGCAPICA